MLPPVSLNSVEAYRPLQCVWQLFDRYLQFVLPHPTQDWHPCSIFIHKAREASANSPDAYALGLTVAVEGLVNELYSHLGNPSQDFKSAVSKLKEFVATWAGIPGWEGNDSLRDRLPNLISQLTSVRAVDRLYELAKQGIVESRHVDAWRQVRHPMAHAELPNGEDYQLFSDRIFSVTVLLYQIVFASIGYDSYYHDYSIHGFPVAKYVSPSVISQ